MATWPPRSRSTSGFLHAKETVGELINGWERGCVGQPHLWLGHVAPAGGKSVLQGGEGSSPRLHGSHSPL
jgi:hypothetical protein